MNDKVIKYQIKYTLSSYCNASNMEKCDMTQDKRAYIVRPSTIPSSVIKLYWDFYVLFTFSAKMLNSLVSFVSLTSVQQRKRDILAIYGNSQKLTQKQRM